METLAPPVVAVVVAHDPGSWFEETLASLGSQDYAELSVLILDNGSTVDQTARVAAVLPSAFVRRFEKVEGFGAVANEVRSMVDGASFFLFCHDDVALSVDAVHLMVEESFRSNAGIVSPKVVEWDDPGRLVQVGMAVDKTGSVVNRVQPFEIDHGQHDAVRDVFVAPGGCMLVRVDLFEELGGFDSSIVAMGEDLDLCWRAQIAGARVVVAPAASVRHREELASGRRRLAPSLTGSSRGQRLPVSIQALQRRHELLAVLKCYGPLHWLRVVPQIALLSIGEYIVAILAGNRTRARTVVHAWAWNLSRFGTILKLRRQVQAVRRLSDKEIRLLQLGGSARLSSYARRVFQHGFHGAHADELEAAAAFPSDLDAFPSDPQSGASTVRGDQHRTEAEAVRAPARPTGSGSATPPRGRLGAGVSWGWWLAALAVVVFGSRQLLSGALPSMGQFVPFPGWAGTFSQFAAGWHPSGVGSTAPATPAFAVAGAVGTLLFGAMGLTQKVLVFGCIPIGAWGMVRLVRPFGSQRASLVAGIVYLAVPLPYDAIALGRLGALAVYGGAPWVLGHLFRFIGDPPYPRTGRGTRTGIADVPRLHRSGRGTREWPGQQVPPAALVLPGRRWLSRHRGLRAVLLLGVVEGLLISFVPSAAVVVLLGGAAVSASSFLLGQGRSALRSVGLAAGATVAAGVLCLPWVIGVLSAGRGAESVLGTVTPPSGAASWGTLLRFSVGPIGGSPLGWGFVVAAILPLLIGRGARFRWACNCWAVAVVFWLFAWLVGRGWTGGLAVDPMVLLGPAAAAIAMAIGLGIAAFEEDLRAAAFGWRQVVTGVAAVVVVMGTFPTLVSALPGRWDAPTNDFTQTLAWMHGKASGGAFRVLWIGDPRSLNEGSWNAGGGVSYATSENGPPNAAWLWNAASPGPASRLAAAVREVRQGRTDRLGAMLAPAGVRYVVSVTALAPVIPPVQTPAQYALPADLTAGLERQIDLRPVLAETGITVYANTDWLPVRAAASGRAASASATAQRASAVSGWLPATQTPPGRSVVPGAVPVLPGPASSTSFRGVVGRGTVLAALAPAGRWQLTGPSGKSYPFRTSFGWAGQYQVPSAGVVTLRFDGGLWAPAGVVLQVLLWSLLAAALIERRGIVRPWIRVTVADWRLRMVANPHLGPESSDLPAGEVPGLDEVSR